MSPLKRWNLPTRDLSPDSSSDACDIAASVAGPVGLMNAANALAHCEQARATEWSFCKTAKLDDDIIRNIDSLAEDAAGVRHRRRKSLAHWRLRAEQLEMERHRM